LEEDKGKEKEDRSQKSEARRKEESGCWIN